MQIIYELVFYTENIPHMQHRSGCTRELFRVITEWRIGSSVGELEEHIKRAWFNLTLSPVHFLI